MPLHATSAQGLSLSRILPDGHWFNSSSQPRITSCCTDASQCNAGDLFVVLDNDRLIDQEEIDTAIENGAVAILTERPLPNAVPQFLVDDCPVAFGVLCQSLSSHPCSALHTIGVAGSFGQASTSRLIGAMLKSDRKTPWLLPADQLDRCGPMALAKWLAEAGAASADHAILETPSTTLAKQQFSGVQLDAAVITNIRQDPTGFHPSLKHYQSAVTSLLDHLKPGGFAVINQDDPTSKQLLDKLDVPTLTIGIESEAQITATLLERQPSEQTFLVNAGSDSSVVRTRMIGDDHIYNCLSAIAVGLALDLEMPQIIAGIESVRSVETQLHRVDCGQPYHVYVDACQTRAGLEHAIRTLRPLVKGDLHVLVGVDHRSSCIERAQVGRLLETESDSCVISSTRLDRKLSLALAHEVLDGFDRPAQGHLMPDRARAICWTLSNARPGDAVLLAGGRESVGPDDTKLVDEDVVHYWLHDSANRNHCPWLPA